jgi:hypothetical protein
MITLVLQMIQGCRSHGKLGAHASTVAYISTLKCGGKQFRKKTVFLSIMVLKTKKKMGRVFFEVM